MRLSATQVAAELRDRDFPICNGTPAGWARQHPGLAVRVCRRWLFEPVVVELITTGVPLNEIPARLQRGAGDAARAT
jgi:hypothetical protein